ncbi:MAG: polysaccharide deacetylase family protein [Steroidobacteraceae bacterium]
MRKLPSIGSWLIRLCSWITTQGEGGAALAILIFHRVLPEFDPLLASEPDAERFAAILDLLQTHFRVLELAEALLRLRERRLPKRALCVTFDDGYANNYTVALPILLAKGAPATVFVASGFLDGGRMFNDTIIEAVRRAPRGLDLRDIGLGIHELSDDSLRVNAIESIIMKLKYAAPDERSRLAEGVIERAGPLPPSQLMMTSAQLRALHKSGVQIGAHTVTHPILASVSEEEAREEITSGKRQLETILGAPVTLFAYPNGKPGTDYHRNHVEIARRAGFEAALSTAWAVAHPDGDRFQIPRIAPWDRSALRYGLRIARSYRVRIVQRAQE